MGEQADYIIGQILLEHGCQYLGRRSRPRVPFTRTCKYCGAGRLDWKEVDGKWVLIEIGGKKHFCDPPLPKIPR